jgi:Protein of unknown function (DUF998)
MTVNQARTTDPTRTRTARRLVAAGTLAAPLLVITWAIQAITRDGYDLTRHPMSLLALGSGGFVQIANFVVTGLLVIALGRGVRLLYRDGIGRTWVPRLIQLAGIGLVISGVFTTDPGAGFPEGAPEGMPDFSVHGILHEVGFVIVIVSWTATLIILYRRFRREGNRPLVLATIGTFLVVLLLFAFPHLDSLPIRTVAVAGIQLAFLAALAHRELRRLRTETPE